MLLLFILLPLSFTIPTIFAWQLFEKAGVDGWKTLIPFYNLYVWLKIIKKPLWWYIFLLIPFINVFVYMLMIVEMLKCYNKFGLGEQAIGVIFPFIYLPYLGFSHHQWKNHYWLEIFFL
jgi:signal peptidase I